MRCKESSTQYGRPQVAGLQRFAKFPTGESVTPRGGSTQQMVIFRSEGLGFDPPPRQTR